MPGAVIAAQADRPTAGFGYYGKMPACGDFVARGLARSFYECWDTWLQQSIAQSKESLGDAWLNDYLEAPIWRFVVMAGSCGPVAHAGVLMPSVDKVGRYFPMTLASPLPDPVPLSQLVTAEGSKAGAGFDAMEKLVLSCLDDHFDRNTFEGELDAASASWAAELSALHWTADEQLQDWGEQVHCMTWTSDRKEPRIQSCLLELLAQACRPAISVWWLKGAKNFGGAVVVAKGLPAPDVFVKLLKPGLVATSE